MKNKMYHIIELPIAEICTRTLILSHEKFNLSSNMIDVSILAYYLFFGCTSTTVRQ